MPNPKSGTVTFEIGKAFEEIRNGRVEYKVDKAGVVHVPIGRASFNGTQIAQNAEAIFSSVVKAKPSSSKGKYIKGATMCSTMGPGIQLECSTITRQVD